MRQGKLQSADFGNRGTRGGALREADGTVRRARDGVQRRARARQGAGWLGQERATAVEPRQVKARPCEGVARAAGGGAGASRVKAGADGCGGSCARGEERRGDGQEWGAGTRVQVTVELQRVQPRWCMASTATGSTREGKKSVEVLTGKSLANSRGSGKARSNGIRRQATMMWCGARVGEDGGRSGDAALLGSSWGCSRRTGRRWSSLAQS